MNERIRDMLEEATEVHDNWRTGHSERVVDYKVFAELIVRECMDQVDEFSRLIKAYQEQGIDPEIDVAKEVLKNFGVEE